MGLQMESLHDAPSGAVDGSDFIIVALVEIHIFFLGKFW